MERYADDMEYESHKERCTNHDVSYNIKYKSHKERYENNVESESKQKEDQEGGIKLSYIEALTHLSVIHKVGSVTVASMYTRVDELVADLHDQG